MKKETIKEIGKYHLDISKILAGLTVVTPFMKNGKVEIFTIVVVIAVTLLGFIFINKGAKNE